MNLFITWILKRKNFIFIIILSIQFYLPNVLVAQEMMEDVVYLKNGSIIRGIIMEQVPNESIKIKTRDGNVFVYKMEKVEKITKVPIFVTRVDNIPMGKTAFIFNPLGFLQFGPVISGEFSMASNTFFTLNFRYLALGIAFQAIESDEFENEVSFGSMSFGAGIKQFLNNPNSPHRFYFAGSAEYGFAGARGDKNSEDEWEGTDATIIFMGNFGHRWRFPSKFCINFGLFFGIAKLVKDEWWYINNPGQKFEEELGTHIFGMFELSIGWEK